MIHEDLEQTYEALARKIDEVGEAHSELFLAKLVLLLAHANGDTEAVGRMIDSAAYNLSGSPRPKANNQ